MFANAGHAHPSRGNRPARRNEDRQDAMKIGKWRSVMNRLMLGSLSIFLIHIAQIAHAGSPTLADDRYVAEAAARNAILWDVRSADAYAAGHIASAVHIGEPPRVLRDADSQHFS